MKFTSNLLVQASGSVGGSTYSRNRGGQYIRNRSKPTNPNTPAQSAVRNALSVVSNYYANTCTAAQRGDWQAFANSNPVINSVGNSQKLSALQMFMKVNIPLFQAGGLSAIQADSPGAVTLLSALSYGPTLGETAGVFTLDVLGPGPFAIGDVINFYITTPCSAGRTPVNQPQGLLYSHTLTAVPTVPDNYTGTAPDPYAGSRSTGSPWQIRAYWVRGANISPSALMIGAAG